MELKSLFLCSNEEGVDISYREWFEIILSKISENTPFIFDKFVLVKVTCLYPKRDYYFDSDKSNIYGVSSTELNIFNKGHDTTKVSILHPNSIIKSIQMNEGNKYPHHHRWTVATIPKKHISEDGFFIVLCVKK